jgi:hypothetical protein
MLTNREKASDIGNRMVFSGVNGRPARRWSRTWCRFASTVNRSIAYSNLIAHNDRNAQNHAQIRSAANLLKKSRHVFHAPYNIKGNEAAELFRQVK